MTTSSDTDIKELKELIVSQFKQLNDKIDEIKIGQIRLEEKLTGLEKRLDDTKTGLEKRLDDTKTELKKQLDDTKTGLEKQLDDTKTGLERQLDSTKTGLEKQLDDGKTGVEKRLDDINTRLTKLDSRVTGQTNWFILLFGVLVTGILGIIGKIALFRSLEIGQISSEFSFCLLPPASCLLPFAITDN